MSQLAERQQVMSVHICHSGTRTAFDFQGREPVVKGILVF